MSDRSIHMPEFWDDGVTRRSRGGPFDALYVARGATAPTVIPPKRGPRADAKPGQKPPALPGTRTFDTSGRASVNLAPRTQGAISIAPFDPTRAARLKASI